MSSEFGERRVLKGGCVGSVGGGGAGQQEPENVQCPRCESTNTKFCYYNNYNLSQPRYFCKSCRRYWTRGGSLRNIPVGGGSRKSSKRSRGGASSSTSSTSCATSQPPPLTNDIISNSDKTMTSSQGLPILDTPVSLQGSFSSLLGSVHQDNPFLGLGGYGLGLGFDGSSFGSGTGVAGSSDQEPPSGWHEPEGGDCFGWPELAISTPAGTPRFEHTFWPAN